MNPIPQDDDEKDNTEKIIVWVPVRRRAKSDNKEFHPRRGTSSDELG